MPYFAEVDENNIVKRVISITKKTIDTGLMGDASKWIQTSYNTRGGKHYDSDSVEDSGVALRYNYASRGMTYDSIRDAFITQQPYPSWTLVETTCHWESPVVYPIDGKNYSWDEGFINWVEITE